MTGPDLTAPHRLILVRHGATRHTLEQRFSGAGYAPEPGLEHIGVAQARAVADRLRELAGTDAIDDLLTSPLLRARQTAAVIAQRLGAAGAVVDPAWSEAHFGRWEGRTPAEVDQSEPGALQRFWSDPFAAPPGGESRAQVQQRVLRRWEGMVRPGRTSLVVTHLTPIRAVVAAALRTPPESFARIVAEPGTITVIERWRDGGAVVRVLGERPHGTSER